MASVFDPSMPLHMFLIIIVHPLWSIISNLEILYLFEMNLQIEVAYRLCTKERQDEPTRIKSQLSRLRFLINILKLHTFPAFCLGRKLISPCSKVVSRQVLKWYKRKHFYLCNWKFASSGMVITLLKGLYIWCYWMIKLKNELKHSEMYILASGPPCCEESPHKAHDRKYTVQELCLLVRHFIIKLVRDMLS